MTSEAFRLAAPGWGSGLAFGFLQKKVDEVYDADIGVANNEVARFTWIEAIIMVAFFEAVRQRAFVFGGQPAGCL